jgi:PilZ domain
VSLETSVTSAVKELKAAMKERRSVPRQKSFLQGRIFFNNRRTSLDCLIRDFSEQGARLKFSATVSTPDAVELFVPSKEETYRARIIWRNADEVGVCFGCSENSPSLAPGLPQADLSARVQKLEHDLVALQRKFNELQATVRNLQGAD